MTSFDATTAWQSLLQQVIQHGSQVCARFHDTLELECVKSRIDMKNPVVTLKRRKIGYRFMAAEAAWVLSGSNQLRDIAPYAAKMRDFTDDGWSLRGAYGPKVTEQLQYCVESLVHDAQTRQAVIGIWREAPRASRDIPCTLALQFLVRNRELHCIATMRSSDLWLGWPYDVFTFSMVSAFLLLRIRENFPDFEAKELGHLHLVAGSQHIYKRNLQDACACATETDRHRISPLNLSQFSKPDHLWRHLCNLKDDRYAQFKSQFMAEIKDIE